MATQISLLGLGRLGGSLALALKDNPNVQVVGYDREAGAAAKSAVSRMAGSPAQTVDGADLVILALPLDEQRAMLDSIGGKVREGGVIMSLSPVLRAPLDWAASLPAGRYFVAAHPTVNPEQLLNPSSAPQADLFARGLWALAPGRGCVPEAVQLASDFAVLLGAKPYFIDPLEHDGLMGGAEALPVLFAWALMQTAAKSAGWPDLRKMADERFAAATALLADAERAPLLLNRDSALQYLDRALVELESLREKLQAADAADLDQLLADADRRRAKWLAEKRRADWQEPEPVSGDVPTVGSMLGHLFAGNLFSKKPGDKKDE